MTVGQQAGHKSNGGIEQRKHKRIELSVAARFMCAGGSEQSGQLLDISPGGLSIESEARPEIGGAIIIYVNELGRMQGNVVRHIDKGFAVQFEASDAKRERLAARLTWLANRDSLNLPTEEFSLTDQPTEQPRFTLGDGRLVNCRVLDMSVHGVWLEVDTRPPVGDIIYIGRMKGRVSRHHQTGIAIEFLEEAAN